MNFIHSWQNKMSIRRKLLLITAVISIIPVVIFAVLITRVYDDTVEKGTRQSVDDSNIVISDRITRILKDAENCSNYLTVNINKALGSTSPDISMDLADQNAINNEMNVAKIVFDEVESIAFIGVKDQILVSDYGMNSNEASIKKSSQLEALKLTRGKSIWFPCEKRDFLVRDNSVPVLTLGKKVLQINTGSTLGYLLININMSKLQSILSNQQIHYRLEDSGGQLVSSALIPETMEEQDITNLLAASENQQVQRYDGRRYYVSNHTIEDYNWKLISITDLNNYEVADKKVIYLLIVIAAAAILLEMLLSSYLSRIITVPLQKLKSGAEEIAGGNMTLRLNFKSEDEIGQLGRSFNYMAAQVQELLVKVDYEARKKQEYELSLLQEQVKPHFLYNCLDIITKLIEMNRQREAKRAVHKLADYYRVSLSDSKNIISIEQELKIVEDYLELQKIRYKDLFQYEIVVDEALLSMPIPKLTLQPLIENAIYHGLKYIEGNGTLSITGTRTDNGICLTVEDNGAGMSEDTIPKILANNPDGHFGVYSVNHRIRLYFGEEYGIRITSELQKGTKIEVFLPEEKK